jgi:ubiquinone/menaquinone biosynthesis C-methylase UbiE
MTNLYDSNQSQKWCRSSPQTVTDFIVRPVVVDMVNSFVKTNKIIDVGCGEGYLTRILSKKGRVITGTDKSKAMIRQAIDADALNQYLITDAISMPCDDNEFDIAISCFVSNYISSDNLSTFYQEIARVVRPNGKFVFAMPNPKTVLSIDFGSSMQYLRQDIDSFKYVENRNKSFCATLTTIEGLLLNVKYIHTPLEEHLRHILNAQLNVEKTVFPKASTKLVQQFPQFAPFQQKSPYIIIAGTVAR